MAADLRYADLPNDAWTSFVTGIQYPFDPTFTLGKVLFTQAEMDTWPNTGTPYTATASSFVGNTSFVFTDHNTSITTDPKITEFHEQSVRAKGQACLWQADGNSARLAKAIEYLNGIKDITTISVTVGQDNLDSSWAACNFLPTAAIIGRANYDNAQFDSFLRNVLWPLMDWSTGGNWFVTFAAARLGIAAYLEDVDLWEDAKAYTAFRLAQVVYHSDYDGATINPIQGVSFAAKLWPATISSPPNATGTALHWWNAVTAAPYTAQYGAYVFEDGVDCEIIRDLGHQAMTMTGFAQAALTIRACGDTVPAEMIDRITALAAWSGRRTLHWLQNGSLETASPPGTAGTPTGVASNNYRYGWWTVKRLLGDDAPAVVDTILLDPDIQPPPSYAGQNHQTIERFSEGTLV